MGIAGRFPVYLDGEFWGLVSVTLDYPAVLTDMSSLHNLDSQGFGCRVWRINADTGDEQTILETGTGVMSRGI